MSKSVVFQLRSDDPEAILGATQAAKNCLAVVPNSPTEIVVQGGAVTGLKKDTAWADKLCEYVDKLGCVKVLACENALKSHEVDLAELLDMIGTVPAGVAHVAQRQWDGWAYLRV